MKAVKRILVLLVFCLLLSPMQVGLCSSVVSQLESFSELEALLTKLDSLSNSVDAEIDEKTDLTKAAKTSVAALEDASEDASDLSQLKQLAQLKTQLSTLKSQLASVKSKLGTTKSSLSTANKSLSGLTDDLKTKILKATLQSDSLGIAALSALLKII
jgi:chromosome segregation ATPase